MKKLGVICKIVIAAVIAAALVCLAGCALDETVTETASTGILKKG